jgi:hypothetical protein
MNAAIISGLASAGITYMLYKNPVIASGFGIGSYLFVSALD